MKSKPHFSFALTIAFIFAMLNVSFGAPPTDNNQTFNHQIFAPQALDHTVTLPYSVQTDQGTTMSRTDHDQGAGSQCFDRFTANMTYNTDDGDRSDQGHAMFQNTFAALNTTMSRTDHDQGAGSQCFDRFTANMTYNTDDGDRSDQGHAMFQNTFAALNTTMSRTDHDQGAGSQCFDRFTANMTYNTDDGDRSDQGWYNGATTSNSLSGIG